MVDRPPRLRLPLMHHFVQERVEHGRPSVAPDVAPGNHDLSGRAVTGHMQFAETSAHAIGEMNGDGAQRAAKVACIELHVHLGEALDQRLVLRRDWPRTARRPGT